jgi:hypothetical protein
MQVTRNFECHITIVPFSKTLNEIEKAVKNKYWKFSRIEGDADLGDGAYCYATKWFETFEEARDETHKVSFDLICAGFGVIRKKIEHVVSDWRIVNGVFKEM